MTQESPDVHFLKAASIRGNGYQSISKSMEFLDRESHFWVMRRITKVSSKKLCSVFLAIRGFCKERSYNIIHISSSHTSVHSMDAFGSCMVFHETFCWCVAQRQMVNHRCPLPEMVSLLQMVKLLLSLARRHALLKEEVWMPLEGCFKTLGVESRLCRALGQTTHPLVAVLSVT